MRISAQTRGKRGEDKIVVGVSQMKQSNRAKQSIRPSAKCCQAGVILHVMVYRKHTIGSILIKTTILVLVIGGAHRVRSWICHALAYVCHQWEKETIELLTRDGRLTVMSWLPTRNLCTTARLLCEYRRWNLGAEDYCATWFHNMEERADKHQRISCKILQMV